MLSLYLCSCCHFPDDDLSRSDSRREESHERIEAVSLRENMSCVTHGSGGLDIPGLRYDYLCIFVEPCCVEMFIVCYCRCQWNGFP